MEVLNSIIYNNQIEWYKYILSYLSDIPISTIKIGVSLNYNELTELMIDQQNINKYKKLYRVAINNTNIKILKILLDKYNDISGSKYALYIPIKDNNYEIFNLLLKYITDPNDLAIGLSNFIYWNRVNMVDRLLKLSIDVNQKDFLGKAVKINDMDIVKLLLSYNAVVTSKSINIGVE